MERKRIVVTGGQVLSVLIYVKSYWNRETM